jgi:hypothetical protein
MNRFGVLAAGVSAVVVGAAAFGTAPVKKAGSPPPPIASYWMDVSTTSGFGAGMMAGGSRPNVGAIMAAMNGGGGGSVAHTLQLRLSSRDKPAGTPQAQHFIPAGLDMGASLPLVTPEIERASTPSGPSEPGTYEKPKGRMLIYWGCGEHAAAGEPMVIDLAKMTSGQVPENLKALSKMAQTMGRSREPTAGSSPGFGEWPNVKDSRTVPAAGSLVGAHRVEGNYSPAIAFNLGQGQDFMPSLGLHEAGATPSGADPLEWRPVAQATGYALSMFGANGNGDVIIWTSAKSASMAPAFDYLSPAEVKRLIASGAVLPPSTSQCTLPAEVAAAVPQGMVMGIGYGPEAFFADSPRAPKWTARVRFKSTAMLMRGMGGMGQGDSGGQAQTDQPQQPQPKKKHRGFGLGDLLGGAIPH